MFEFIIDDVTSGVEHVDDVDDLLTTLSAHPNVEVWSTLFDLQPDHSP